MMGKNEFYYRLLNIGKESKNVEIVFDKIVKKEMNTLSKGNKNMVGLCKVLATNLSIELDNEDVDYRVVNLENYFLYDHTFIVARNIENGKLNYYLIDPSFIQFKGYYPYDNLENNDSKLLNDLIKKGYSRIDNKDYNLYFSAFLYDGKVDINNLFLEFKRKSKLSR